MGLTGRADDHNPVVSETDKEIHKHIQEAAIQCRATHTHVNLLIGWPFNGKIQYLRPWSIGSPIGKYRIWSISWEMMQTLRREWGMAILQEQKYLMLYQRALYHCHTLVGDLEEVFQFVVPTAHWVAAINGCHWDAGHLVSSKGCTYCRTSSGGPSWPHRCRKWSATVNDASNMKTLVPKHQCSPSLPLLLCSYYK